MKLSKIAEIIGGKLSRAADGSADGSADQEITGVSDLENQKPGTIAYTEKKKHLELLKTSQAAALIIPMDLECSEKPCIKIENPKLSFSKVLGLFSPYQPYPKKIYPNVHIEPTARLGKDVTVLPFTNIMDNASVGDGTVIYSQVFIGKNVKIGKNCVIKAGVKIDDETVIGNNVIIHHNAVIGGDGFGYVQQDGVSLKIPQIGKIIIGDDVEIGAGVMIDRATMGETVIQKGVKIDNLVQIAHNVFIGENSIIVSQVGIAGSSRLGKNCILAGQVGVADHVTMGDNVVALAQAGIESKQVLPSGSIVLGSPAREMMEQKRIYAGLSRLPAIVKTVTAIRKKLGMDDETK